MPVDSSEPPGGASNAFVPAADPTDVRPGDGPLSGLRLGVKDVFDVAGQRTLAGAPARSQEAPATENAALVALMLRLGATYAGRTVCDELAFSLMGTNAHYPAPRNAAAPDRVTGGSSSGSAAAAAAGEVDFSLATDTGGSIRAPASFCGLVGLRPTHALLPLDGCLPLASSLDVGGWLARDLPTTLRIGDALWRPLEPPPRPRVLRSPALEALVSDAAASREWRRIRAGCEAILGPAGEIDLGGKPHDLYRTFRVVQAAEAWATHGAFVETHGSAMNPDVRARFEWGRDLTDAQVGGALRDRDAFTAFFIDEMGEDGILVLPTVPGPAPLRAGSADDHGAFRERALHLLCIAGLCGMPQLSLPLGSVEGGPFGLSLIGPRGADASLLALGARLMERFAPSEAGVLERESVVQ